MNEGLDKKIHAILQMEGANIGAFDVEEFGYYSRVHNSHGETGIILEYTGDHILERMKLDCGTCSRQYDAEIDALDLPDIPCLVVPSTSAVYFRSTDLENKEIIRLQRERREKERS